MAQGRKPKPKKLTLNIKTTWRNILKEIEKQEVPVHVLESLTVYLKDGTLVTIDIKGILAEGADPDEVELHVNNKLEELDAYIDNVDFFVDLDVVQAAIQPETDRVLANL